MHWSSDTHNHYCAVTPPKIFLPSFFFLILYFYSSESQTSEAVSNLVPEDSFTFLSTIELRKHEGLNVLRGKAMHDLESQLGEKTCALVSNSGELLLTRNENKGIDKHDIVVRLNFAPFLDYSKFVGRQVHLVFTGYPPLVGLPERPNFTVNRGYKLSDYSSGRNITVILADAFCANDTVKPKHLRNGIHKQYVCETMTKKAIRKCTDIFGIDNCARLHTEDLNFIWKDAKRRSWEHAVSSGWVSYKILQNWCKCVDVYGFSGTNKAHYWFGLKRARKSVITSDHRKHKTLPRHDMTIEGRHYESTCTFPKS